MIHQKALLLVSALAISAPVLAQEVPFSDYVQPQRDFAAGKQSFDSPLSFGTYQTLIVGGSTGDTVSGYAGLGLGWAQWAANGTPSNDATVGFLLDGLQAPKGGAASAYDIQMMLNPEVGAPNKFRVDLVYSDAVSGDIVEQGTVGNGGIIDLSTANSWQRIRVHRTNSLTFSSSPVSATSIRIVALQTSSGTYTGVAGTYNPSAYVSADNIKITVPRKLRGLFKFTDTGAGGGSKDIGAFTFNSAGTALGNYAYWMQNTNNDVINLFGLTDICHNVATTNKTVSNLLLTSVDPTAGRQYVAERPDTALSVIEDAFWIGTTDVAGNLSTDKYYGYTGYPPAPGISCVFRQTTSGSNLIHRLRIAAYSTGYAPEIPLNLGGEPLVAVGDFDGDGLDDFVTRSGSTLQLRTLTSVEDKGLYFATTVSPPSTISIYGNLTCFGVADFNGDGFDDLLLYDSSGNFYTSITGGTVQWVFQLGASDKALALCDADGDGLPEIYTSRLVSTGVNEINIRKLNAAGTAQATATFVAQYNSATFTCRAVGDINGDGSADLVFHGNDAPYYTVITILVNPATRTILGSPSWITNANTPTVRSIFSCGL
jgi:hypothetical protein